MHRAALRGVQGIRGGVSDAPQIQGLSEVECHLDRVLSLFQRRMAALVPVSVATDLRNFVGRESCVEQSVRDSPRNDEGC